MPGLLDDPRVRQLWLFFRRLLSGPSLDVDSVPAILDMSRSLQVFWRRMQILAAGVIVLVIGVSVYTLKTDPREFDGFNTFCEVVPSLAFLVGARLVLIRIRASFGQFDVTVQEGGKTWTEPIEAYRGLAWMYFKTVSYSQLFLTARRAEYREWSTPTSTDHHWIELVHPDPQKTLILAVSMKDGDLGERLDRFSRCLKRPIVAKRVEIVAK